jgi:polyphosphate glucokinase
MRVLAPRGTNFVEITARMHKKEGKNRMATVAKSVALGIDIGGTGIKGAPVDTRTGKLLDERFRVETPKGAKVAEVCRAAAEVVKHFKWKGPIGCTLPSVVQRGVVRTAANISEKWIGVNGARVLTQALKNRVVLLNDADAAGIAEMRFGAGKGEDGLVAVVTLGTGIGTAIFCGGKLIPNSELGHLIIDGKDAEELASNRVREEEDLSWKDWAKQVERYLQYLESLLWPEVILIGGGVSKQASKFIPRISVRAKLLPAKLLNSAGIIGAAMIATNKDL